MTNINDKPMKKAIRLMKKRPKNRSPSEMRKSSQLPELLVAIHPHLFLRERKY